MKTYIKEYFNNNIFEYFKLLIITIIGIVVAIISINNVDITGKQEIKQIINTKIESVKNSQNVDTNMIFIRSIKKNIREFIIIVFLATTIIGIPIAYFFIVKKAFSIGYTISAIFATQSIKTSIIFIFSGLLVHNIIYLLSFFIVLVEGENLLKKIIKKESKIKIEIVRYLLIVVISMIVVIIASFIESYFAKYFLNVLKKYL